MSIFLSFYQNYFQLRRTRFGYIHKSVKIRFPSLIKGIENVYLHENTQIMGYAKIITSQAKFIMMKNSGAAEGLTVITGTHPAVVGRFFIEDAKHDKQKSADVFIEEDVWVAANVTILAGVKVGRGSIISAGSVVCNSVPPYSIVQGNPAKVVGFKFSVSEICAHELLLYPQADRLSIHCLHENYQKFFVDRLSHIKQQLR